MKRIALVAGLATCLGLFTAAVRADDTVLRHDPANPGKDKILRGTIQEETPAGVKIKVGNDVQTVPPDDVVYIAYDVNNITEPEFEQPLGLERQARGETGDVRKKDFADALSAYQALLTQVKGAANAERFVRYRMAMLAVDQAQDDPSKVKAAIAALNDYRSTHGTGWEIVPATKTVARLLEESGDKKGALNAYNDLGKDPDVPADIRLSTNLLVAHMLIQDGQFDAAEKKLSSVLADTKDEKRKAYVQASLLQTQVAQGKMASPAGLQDLIKGAGDDDKLKAMAYNTLGDYYQQAKQPDEAFWDYLRVDVLFNQDREEHARALYHLWKLFASVRSDPQRSQECLDRLKDKSMDGTEYQARAIQETEAGSKSP